MAINWTAPVRKLRWRARQNNKTTRQNIASYSTLNHSFEVQRVAENTKFFGQVICQRLSLKMRPDASHDYTVNEYWRLSFSENGSEYEYHFPFFFTTEVHTDENTGDKTITAYDWLKDIEQYTFEDLNINPPYTIRQVAEAVASFYNSLNGGITRTAVFTNIGNETLNLSYATGANLNGDEKLIDILSMIAEVCGAVCFINKDDNLEFKRLDKDGEPVLTIAKDDYFKFKSGDNKRLQTIIYATELGDNVEAHTSAIGSTQAVRNNAFLDNRSDRMALVSTAIATYGGLTIGQVDLDWRANLDLEIGDKIAITAKDGSAIITYLLDEVIKWKDGLSSKLCYKWEQGKEADESANPATIGDAFNTTFAKVDKINNRIDLVVAEQEETNQAVAGVRNDLTGVSSQVTTNTNNIASLTLTTGGITADVNNLTTRVSTNENNIATVTTDLGTTKTTLNQTKTQVATNKQDIANLSVTTEGISASVNNLESSLETTNATVSSMTVGGRNLFIAKDRTNNKYVDTDSNLATWQNTVMSDYIPLEADKTYIMQVWQPANTTATGSDRSYLIGYLFDENKVRTGATSGGYFTTDYYKATFKNTNGTFKYIRVLYHMGSVHGSGANWNPFGAYKVKCECGTMPTEWSIAPEDVDGRITDNTTLAGGIRSDLTTTQTQVQTNKQDIASLKVTAQGISADVSNLETATQTLTTTVQNISIGGRNLLPISALTLPRTQTGLTVSYLEDGWLELKGTATNTSTTAMNLWGVASSSSQMLPAGQYTISFEQEGNVISNGSPVDGQKIAIQIGRYVNGTYTAVYLWADASSKTINFPEPIALVRLWIHSRTNGTTYNGKFRVKMENGNKATTWTPAPEDVEAGIAGVAATASSIRSDLTTTQTQVETNKQNIASLQVTTNGISANVSDLQSTTTTLSQTVETVEQTANTAKTTANTAKSTADTAKSTADTAKSTATTAKNTADTAKSTADTAKTTADTAKTTADTAKTTATNAKNKADAVETSLNSVSAQVSTNTSNISNLQVTTQGISADVSNLQTDTQTLTTTVDNLSVGGRNLFIAKDRTNNKYINTSGALAEWVDTIVSDWIEAKPNTDYTVQVWQVPKTQAEIDADKTASFVIAQYDSSKAFISGTRAGTACTTLSYTKNTIKTKSNAAYIRVHYHYGGTETSPNWNPFGIHKVKVEEGNKPTGWSIAPEDLDSRITANATTASGIRSDLTSTQTQVTTNKNNIASLQTTTGSISASVSSLESTTTTLSNKVDAMKVGNRNLFIAKNRTNDKYCKNDDTLAGWTKSVLSEMMPVTPGIRYIAQAWKPTNESATGTNRGNLTIYAFDSNQHYYAAVSGSGYFTNDYKMIGWTPSTNVAYCRIFYHFGEDGVEGADWDIFGDFQVKFEQGSMPTGWSPAPEDMVDVIEQEATELRAEINITDNRITSTVEELNSGTTAVQNALDAYKSSNNAALVDINGDIASVRQATSLLQSKTEAQASVITELQNSQGKATQVVTTTATLNNNGLTVQKSSSAVSTTISENGMQVKDGTQVELSANSEGVVAHNLSADNYLIIDNMVRWQAYGNGRIGCYWIGG